MLFYAYLASVFEGNKNKMQMKLFILLVLVMDQRFNAQLVDLSKLFVFIINVKSFLEFKICLVSINYRNMNILIYYN